MESPQLTQELKNSDHTVIRYRGGVCEKKMNSQFGASPISVQNIVVSPIKACSSRNEEIKNSTPLRVVRVRRQSFHSIDLNVNPHGTVRTPVATGKKTPIRVPANPFDAVLMDRLHLPICSPSICNKIPEYEEKDFKWDIEQQATLFPAPIEEELHIHHHMHEQYNAEVESKLQDAIDRFYEGRVIAPSPWIATEKCASERGLLHFNSKDESDLSPRTHKDTKGSTQDACTQTVLSLPLHLPPELELALQKYLLPPDDELGSASSSMIYTESESLSTSTRRKLFNAEDMSISQVDSTHVFSLMSPAHNASILPKTASSSPIKGRTILAGLHSSENMDEDEIEAGLLESSLTTFWKATESPPISPVASQRPPPYLTSSKWNGTRTEEKCGIESQYTPPSSRTRQRPLFRYSFAPLLEKDEDNGVDKLNEGAHGDKALDYTVQSQGEKKKELDPNANSSFIASHNSGDIKSNIVIPGFSSTSSFRVMTNIDQTHKVSTLSVSQYQHISHGVNERFDSLGVDDTCTSRMQDTGYQTVSMTTLPGSSLSSNSFKPKGCIVTPMDVGSAADKMSSCPVKICEDGYTSLSFNKIPLASIYDESMTDVWHSSPPPLASSTPAKNFGGFLM